MTAALLALALSGAPGIPGHDSDDPARCATCKPVLEKAVGFVKKGYARGGLAGHTFAGLMFLVAEDFGSDYQACVQHCIGAIDNGGFNRNWHLAMSTYFLSEAYLRRPTAEIAKALTGALPAAAAQQEPTGGWCHHLGMAAKQDYVKNGGGEDIALLTVMMFAAFQNMRAAGLDVPAALVEKTEKNLESNADREGGFKYGTGSGWHDLCQSRGAFALIGLTNAGRGDHPWIEKIVGGLRKRLTLLESGHAFAPFHFFAVAAAMRRIGEYAPFAAEWVDKLSARQQADGSVKLEHDDGKRSGRNDSAPANTAAFATLLLLQKDGSFGVPAPREPGSSGGSGSPFGRPKPPQDGPGPAPKAPPQPHKSPFGRDP